ncbi:hypothetical protein JTE90_012413 [Oedothorax gibbosus]|uniref:CCHC-type domain-containing protein n=1 Tax=Oedothorax gibbosus TaxID=931172 RepID=A0AAV6TVS0_9ARAC|nr:hypothetical protein JTE90_012413 [Oedothorax gibbosus]
MPALNNADGRPGSPRSSTPTSQRSYSLSDSDRKKTQLSLEAAKREIQKLHEIIQANINKATKNDQDACAKIKELESEIKLLHLAQTNFLNNAVHLKEAKCTLEEARTIELEDSTNKNKNLLEGTLQEKLKILEDLRIERTAAAQKDEANRKELLESTDGILAQASVLTQQITQIGTIEEKLAASISTFNHHPPPSLSAPTPLSTPPSVSSADKNRFDNIYVILVDQPSSSPLSLDAFQKQLNQASKEAKKPFRCNGTYTIKSGFKINLPTEEDQAIVADLLQSSPSLSAFKFKIPKKVKPQYIIKFTSISSAEDLAIDLVARNPFISKDTFRVVFSMKVKEDTHWIIETEQQYAYIFNPLFNVFIGLKRCTINEFISINHCKNCGKYGHTKKRCISTAPICLNCGKPEYDPAQECITKCFNCNELNNKLNRNEPTDHRTGNYRCPENMRQLRIARQKAGQA